MVETSLRFNNKIGQLGHLNKYLIKLKCLLLARIEIFREKKVKRVKSRLLTKTEGIDTSIVSLAYQHAVHVEGARTATVRTVRFYGSDTDL